MHHETYHWLDVERIGQELAEAYPDMDPFSVPFTKLKTMIAELPGFREQEGHPANERILEAIQEAWMSEMDQE